MTNERWKEIFAICYSSPFIQAKKLPQWQICTEIMESITRKWFVKFKNPNFDLDMPPSTRLTTFNKGVIEGKRQTSRELA